MTGEADRELTLSASACHIGGPNSANLGQILLVYGNETSDLLEMMKRLYSLSSAEVQYNNQNILKVIFLTSSHHNEQCLVDVAGLIPAQCA